MLNLPFFLMNSFLIIFFFYMWHMWKRCKLMTKLKLSSFSGNFPPFSSFFLLFQNVWVGSLIHKVNCVVYTTFKNSLGFSVYGGTFRTDPIYLSNSGGMGVVLCNRAWIIMQASEIYRPNLAGQVVCWCFHPWFVILDNAVSFSRNFSPFSSFF